MGSLPPMPCAVNCCRSIPQQANDGRLLAAMRSIGRGEADRVAQLVRAQVNRAGETTRDWIAAVEATENSVDRDAEELLAVCVPSAGIVAGVDVQQSKVCWRRFVGAGAAVSPLPAENGAVLLYRAPQMQLECVSIRDGTARWSLDVGLLSGLTLAGPGTLIATSSSGQVRTVATTSGQVVGGQQLPQHTPVGPAVDESAPRVYQVAEYSLLYVLAVDQSKCLSSYYLGHEQGSVTQAPVVLDDHLVVWEQVGPADTTIHVLRCGDTLQPIQTLVVPYVVARQPIVAGGQICAVTTHGQLVALRYNARNAVRPFSSHELWTAPSTERALLPVFVESRDQLIVGHQGLRTLVPGRRVAAEQPAEPTDPDLFVTTLSRTTNGGVAAVGRTDSWPGPVLLYRAADQDVARRVPLDAAPATAPLVAATGKQGWTLRQDGTLLRGDVIGDGPDKLAWRQVSSDPSWQQPADLKRAESGSCWCGPLGLLAVAGTDRLTLVDPDQQEPIELALPQPLAAAPVVLDRQVVVPLLHGPLALWDTRRRMLYPCAFVPEFSAVTLPQWHTPAVISESEIVISDGRRRLFHLQARPDGDTLSQRASTNLEFALVSPLAAVGTTVWAVNDSRNSARSPCQTCP